VSGRGQGMAQASNDAEISGHSLGLARLIADQWTRKCYRTP